MLNGEKGDRVQVYMYTGTGTTDKVNMWTSGNVHWYWHPLAYLIIDKTSN